MDIFSLRSYTCLIINMLYEKKNIKINKKGAIKMKTKILNILGRSKNAKKIMIMLSRYKELTLNEIAKKVKIHENSVRLVLKKLKTEGIVDSIIIRTVAKKNSVEKYFLTEKAKQVFETNFALLLASA